MRILKTSWILFILFWAKTGFSTVYQAETATLYKALTETKNDGFTGESYINFDNEPGSYLELTVGMASEGQQSVKIRFANGTSAIRPMQVKINGQVAVETLEFQPTGDWTNWDTISFLGNFKQGVNLIRITSTGSEGGPNIDYFDVSGEQAQSFTLNVQVSGPGSVIKIPDFPTYFDGQVVQLIVLSDINGVFSGWEGDINTDADTVSILIDGNKTVSANFEEITLEIPEPDFSMTGYATLFGEGYETTTGGEGGKIIYISSINQLINWAKSREDNETPEIVIIQGKLESEETAEISIKHGKNISIFGDPDSENGYAELKNVAMNVRDYQNVIIRNLKMHEVIYPNDDLTIDECHHVWIDHCEFYSKIGPGIGVDTYDGLLDIKKGSHNVTVSWCYLHHHMKTMLVGHSDNNGVQDQNLEVTIHHCWFSNTDGRNPSLRFGHIHYFNNYLNNISDYGFAVRNGAHTKIQNSHFESVNIPVATDKFDGHGFACLSGNIYTGTCTANDNQINDPTGCEYWEDNIPYNYSLEEVNTVALSVQKYAGVGKLENLVTSSKSDNLDKNVLVWPNPACDEINIRITQNFGSPVQISIIDLNGSVLIKSNISDRYLKLSVSDLPSGYYILRIVSSEGVQTIKTNIIN